MEKETGKLRTILYYWEVDNVLTTTRPDALAPVSMLPNRVRIGHMGYKKRTTTTMRKKKESKRAKSRDISTSVLVLRAVAVCVRTGPAVRS